MANRQSLVEFVGTMAFHWSLVYPGFVAHVSPDHSGEKYTRDLVILLTENNTHKPSVLDNGDPLRRDYHLAKK